MKLKTLLTTAGIGAGLMYFLDPQQGDRRRAVVRDRANSLVRDVDETLDTAIEDARSRARGTLAEWTARLGEQGTSPDWVLVERVRSNIGRTGHHTKALMVEASGGRVTLNGPVMREEMEDILKAARRTRGVASVESQLQPFDSAEEIPSLQGQQMEAHDGNLMEQTWSPGQRLLSGVAGGILAAYGMSRGGLMKPLLSGAGLFLAARGLTNMDPRSLLGLGVGKNAIRVQKAININAPVDEVYRFWQNFDNFPQFMSHVKEVTRHGEFSHWKVAGPAGTTVEFDSRVAQDIPNQLIAWESLPDSEVHHTGTVRFDPNWTDNSTRVTVQMQYVPPAGPLGDVVAQLFGVDPREAMNDDLTRLKGLLETNELRAMEA